MMSSSITYFVESTVACKIFFHSAKYASEHVGGFLIGTSNKGGGGGEEEKSKSRVVRLLDAIPLFHHHLSSPILEFSCKVIHEYCKEKKLQILGVYFSSTSEKDTISSVSKKVAKICASVAEGGVFCMLNLSNKKLASKGGGRSSPPFRLIAPITGEGGGHSRGGKSVTLSFKNWPKTFESIRERLSRGEEQEIVDFDAHLENVRLDWRNPSIEMNEPKNDDKSRSSRLDAFEVSGEDAKEARGGGGTTKTDSKICDGDIGDVD